MHIPARNLHRQIWFETIPAFTAFQAGVAGRAHNEPAFHHFLGIERRRAERADQSALLVLVSPRPAPGRSGKFEPAMATAVFSALGASVREADFIGWYREDRVAGAVMTYQPTPLDQIYPSVTGRVTSALGRTLSSSRAPLRVRAVPLRSKAGA